MQLPRSPLRHRRQRFITAAAHYARLGAPDQRRVDLSIVPTESYRSAVINFGLLADRRIVDAPFHLVRLANPAVTNCHYRIELATMEHRGWKSGAICDIRNCCLMRDRPPRGNAAYDASIKRDETTAPTAGCSTWCARDLVPDATLTHRRAPEAWSKLDRCPPRAASRPPCPDFRAPAKTSAVHRQTRIRCGRRVLPGPVDARGIDI